MWSEMLNCSKLLSILMAVPWLSNFDEGKGFHKGEKTSRVENKSREKINSSRVDIKIEHKEVGHQISAAFNSLQDERIVTTPVTCRVNLNFLCRGFLWYDLCHPFTSLLDKYYSPRKSMQLNKNISAQYLFFNPFNLLHRIYGLIVSPALKSWCSLRHSKHKTSCSSQATSFVLSSYSFPIELVVIINAKDLDVMKLTYFLCLPAGSFLRYIFHPVKSSRHATRYFLNISALKYESPVICEGISGCLTWYMIHHVSALKEIKAFQDLGTFLNFIWRYAYIHIDDSCLEKNEKLYFGKRFSSEELSSYSLHNKFNTTYFSTLTTCEFNEGFSGCSDESELDPLSSHSTGLKRPLSLKYFTESFEKPKKQISAVNNLFTILPKITRPDTNTIAPLLSSLLPSSSFSFPSSSTSSSSSRELCKPINETLRQQLTERTSDYLKTRVETKTMPFFEKKKKRKCINEKEKTGLGRKSLRKKSMKYFNTLFVFNCSKTRYCHEDTSTPSPPRMNSQECLMGQGSHCLYDISKKNRAETSLSDESLPGRSSIPPKDLLIRLCCSQETAKIHRPECTSLIKLWDVLTKNFPSDIRTETCEDIFFIHVKTYTLSQLHEKQIIHAEAHSNQFTTEAVYEKLITIRQHAQRNCYDSFKGYSFGSFLLVSKIEKEIGLERLHLITDAKLFKFQGKQAMALFSLEASKLSLIFLFFEEETQTITGIIYEQRMIQSTDLSPPNDFGKIFFVTQYEVDNDWDIHQLKKIPPCCDFISFSQKVYQENIPSMTTSPSPAKSSDSRDSSDVSPILFQYDRYLASSIHTKRRRICPNCYIQSIPLIKCFLFNVSQYCPLFLTRRRLFYLVSCFLRIFSQYDHGHLSYHSCKYLSVQLSKLFLCDAWVALRLRTLKLHYAMDTSRQVISDGYHRFLLLLRRRHRRQHRVIMTKPMMAQNHRKDAFSCHCVNLVGLIQPIGIGPLMNIDACNIFSKLFHIRDTSCFSHNILAESRFAGSKWPNVFQSLCIDPLRNMHIPLAHKLMNSAIGVLSELQRNWETSCYQWHKKYLAHNTMGVGALTSNTTPCSLRHLAFEQPEQRDRQHLIWFLDDLINEFLFQYYNQDKIAELTKSNVSRIIPSLTEGDYFHRNSLYAFLVGILNAYCERKIIVARRLTQSHLTPFLYVSACLLHVPKCLLFCTGLAEAFIQYYSVITLHLITTLKTLQAAIPIRDAFFSQLSFLVCFIEGLSTSSNQFETFTSLLTETSLTLSSFVQSNLIQQDNCFEECNFLVMETYFFKMLIARCSEADCPYRFSGVAFDGNRLYHILQDSIRGQLLTQTFFSLALRDTSGYFVLARIARLTASVHAMNASISLQRSRDTPKLPEKHWVAYMKRYHQFFPLSSRFQNDQSFWKPVMRIITVSLSQLDPKISSNNRKQQLQYAFIIYKKAMDSLISRCAIPFILSLSPREIHSLENHTSHDTDIPNLIQLSTTLKGEIIKSQRRRCESRNDCNDARTSAKKCDFFMEPNVSSIPFKPREDLIECILPCLYMDNIEPFAEALDFVMKELEKSFIGDSETHLAQAFHNLATNCHLLTSYTLIFDRLQWENLCCATGGGNKVVIEEWNKETFLAERLLSKMNTLCKIGENMSLSKFAQAFIQANNLGPIVFMTAEYGKWSSVGGLGVMVKSLCSTLAETFHQDIYVVTPYYKFDSSGRLNVFDDFGIEEHFHFTVNVENRAIEIQIYEGISEGVHLIFLRNEEFFRYIYHRSSIHHRLCFLTLTAKASLEVLCQKHLIPQLIVTNDWPVGLVAAYAKNPYFFGSLFDKTTFFHLIHNLGKHYEGRIYADQESLRQFAWITELPIDLLVDPYWYDIIFNPSRCCLLTCDAWGTVSPSYREEICFSSNSPLAPLLTRYPTPFAYPNGAAQRKSPTKLSPCIQTHENAKAWIQKKYFHFTEPDLSIPLFAFIGRITEQKGVRIIIDSVEDLIIRYNYKIQFILGGKADWCDEYSAKCAEKMSVLKTIYPCCFWANPEDFFTDGALINLGADVAMMPSEFEPGGIVQHEFFMAGTPVLAFHTGGLKDTVFEFNPKTCKGNGFVFTSYCVQDFVHAAERAYQTISCPHYYKILRENASFSVITSEQTARGWFLEFCHLRKKLAVIGSPLLPT